MIPNQHVTHRPVMRIAILGLQHMREQGVERGNYAGGVLRMAFSDSLADDVDEIGLARIIDAKLKGAPSR